MTKTPLARRFLLFVAVAAVAYLGASLFQGPPQLGPVARAVPPDAARASKDKDYDLTQLEVLRKVVVKIKDDYVDPRRIDPREMFLQALEYVEKSAAEVVVHGDAKEGKVKVTVGNATRDFDFKDVESIWMIPHRIRPVFAFIQENLVTTEKKVDLEYAAVNGMLSTLDPHSWLLNPDTYKEMKLQTKGEFGGLGFVIAMDEERLTVRKVLKNTPASRAGIKKGDHIARIEDESTINMDLNEAVSKLRGKPGSEVRIFVRRPPKDEEKLYTLVRATISIESVTSQLLPEGVGYVRLASFAGTTSRDLSAAVRELKEQTGGKLKGLVLDLRSNPGGLLEQAIQVADQFVESGTIVTTVGMSDRLREEKRARNEGSEREFPVAVLVNSESASASEIVAGALKNLNRAVIVGRQTFGKGSVQVLYDMPDPITKQDNGIALKLTIAQYLTPGDRSIQETGVTPDIELVPARVAKDRVDLFAPTKTLREADLDHHFGNTFAPGLEDTARSEARREPAEMPSDTMRYLREEKPKKKDEKTAEKGKEDADEDDEPAAEEPDEDELLRDPQVIFARDLLVRAGRTDRTSTLEAARDFLAQRRADEDARIEKAVAALGVDWTVSKKLPPGPVATAVDFRTEPARGTPGEPFALKLSVKNTGKVPLERLRAWTRCDAEKTAYQQLCRLLDRREFILGRVAPGEEKSWSAPVKLPQFLPAVRENLTLVFAEANGNAPEEQKVSADVGEVSRPSFAWTYQVMDRDGLAQPGETVDVQVDVRNTGAGRSSKGTFVSLRNSANDKIFMKRGRAVLGEIKPGESRSATLSLEVKPGFDDKGGVPLKIEVGDRDMWEFSSAKIVLPGAAAPPPYQEVSGSLKVESDASVLAAPLAGAPLLAEARRGTVLPVGATAGDWVKVEWTKGRWGFVPAASGTLERRPQKADPRLAPAVQRDPPDVSLSGIDTTRGPVVTDQDKFKLSGTAADASGLMDVRVFVDNEKVFFKTARGVEGTASDGKGEAKPGVTRAPKIPFSVEFPLKPGNNMVLVVAREDEDFASQRTLVIHRRGPALADRKPSAAGTPPGAEAPAQVAP